MLCVALALSGVADAQTKETVDLDMVSRIRQEAFHRSQVMATFSHLTEQIGPRLTNSPAMGEANTWTRSKFNEWGLVNVHDEAFDAFGRGWEFSNASVELLSPRVAPLYALPKAWTPGTNGPVEGEVIKVEIKKLADLDQYKGKIAGKILLLNDARDYERATKSDSHRHDDAGLAELQVFAVPKDVADAKADRAKKAKEFLEKQELTRATNAGTTASSASAAVAHARRANRSACPSWR